MDTAYTYINQNGGIDSETYYPYEARVRSVCHLKNYTFSKSLMSGPYFSVV